jgi:cobalt-zinc-cadmium efflux system protein
MSEGHDHHDHSAPSSKGRAFAIGVALNLGFVVVEVIYGVLSHSLALLADAGHNFSDVIALLFAWGAYALASRPPTPRLTYGLRGATILAALANAMLLLVAVGGIIWESLHRLSTPVAVEGRVVIGVALVGVVINTASALLFLRGHEDLNVRGAYLHMAADAAVSLGVVGAGVVMIYTGWLWLDPVMSLAIAAVILIGTWGLLRDSVRLALHAVPAGVDPLAVRQHLAGLAGVADVHDLHIWGMSTTETALTAHLVMPAGHPGDDFIASVAEEIEVKFRINHSTLQVETATGARPCALAPDHVV